MHTWCLYIKQNQGYTCTLTKCLTSRSENKEADWFLKSILLKFEKKPELFLIAHASTLVTLMKH